MNRLQLDLTRLERIAESRDHHKPCWVEALFWAAFAAFVVSVAFLA